jgi:hypothetical protein
MVVDGKVVSAPIIRAPILDGNAHISGDFTLQEAEAIVEKLNSYRTMADEFLEALDKDTPRERKGMSTPSKPKPGKTDRKTAPSADRSPRAAAGRRLTEAAGRRRFLAIERIARWPMAKQAKGLPHFYKSLDPRSISPMVEAILSSYPRNILDTKSGPYDGNTTRWAQQLADAASEMSAEQVADQLGGRLWLDVAARARALQVFKKHAVATSSLVDADLKSGDKFAVQRACNTIAELELRSSTKRLLAMFMADNELSDSASGALAQLRDPTITGPLLERVEQDPKCGVRQPIRCCCNCSIHAMPRSVTAPPAQCRDVVIQS